MVVRKIIESVLPIGSTSVTFTDTDIPNSLLRIYSNDPDLMPTDRRLVGNNLTVTYEAQSSVKNIALEIVKQGLDIVDNLISTDTDTALSAKQGKVLKDLIDGITPIRNLTGLDDVLVVNLSDGDILKYDAEDEVFKNYLLPDIPVYLGDLGDIVLDTVTAGQVLTFNGAYWTNSNASGGESYTTTEEVIGSFLGETLYRKVITSTENLNINANTWTKTNIPKGSINTLVNGRLIIYYEGTYSLHFVQFAFLDNMLAINCYRNFSITIGSMIILEYIKTS